MKRKTTAKQYYNQLEAFDLRGLSLNGRMSNTYSRSSDYFEIGTSRFICETVYFDNPEENTVEIYPTYEYYQNNVIGANKGTKIETFTNN